MKNSVAGVNYFILFSESEKRLVETWIKLIFLPTLNLNQKFMEFSFSK